MAEPTEAQERAVMETKTAAIHQKIPILARQLPITGSAHKAGNGERPLAAATGTVQSARALPAPSGWRTARQSCSTCPTSTSCSRCRNRSPPSRSRTRPWFTTSCSGPPRRRCAPSPPTPGIWVRRSASSPCCIPGDRTSCIIRICTAWCRGAGSHRMVGAGSPAAPGSSCRSPCCLECSGDCSCTIWRRRSPRANCASS